MSTLQIYHCDEHNKDYKGPNSKGKYWHLIDYDTQQYCSKSLSELGVNPNPKAVEDFPDAPKRDFSAENAARDENKARGMVRHGLIVALIEHDGMSAVSKLPVDDVLKDEINYLVEYIMTGK